MPVTVLCHHQRPLNAPHYPRHGSRLQAAGGTFSKTRATVFSLAMPFLTFALAATLGHSNSDLPPTTHSLGLYQRPLYTLTAHSNCTSTAAVSAYTQYRHSARAPQQLSVPCSRTSDRSLDWTLKRTSNHTAATPLAHPSWGSVPKEIAPSI